MIRKKQSNCVNIMPGIEGAYHFNKKYWNSVRFDSDVDDKLMKELIDHSYDEVIKKFTKKLRAEYDALP